MTPLQVGIFVVVLSVGVNFGISHYLLGCQFRNVHRLSICSYSYFKYWFRGQDVGSNCTTLLTLSFGNHHFANYHVLKHPLTKLIMSSFYIPKVLNSATKILEIGSQIKILRPKIFLTRAFSIVKMLPREVTIFPENKIISNFSF